ncbi:MAG: tetratricopeptide repeat protein [Bacteroidota bacterium]
MFKPFVFIIFLLLAANGIAGHDDPLLDSLYRLYNKAKTGKEKTKQLYEIGSAEMVFRLSFWDSLRLDARKYGLKEHEAHIMNNMGFIHNNEGNIQKALYYFQQSLKIREQIKDTAGIANSLNNIAFIYESIGEKQKALEMNLRGLKLRRKINDLQGIAISANNIGTIYHELQQLDKSLKYHLESFEIRKKIDDPAGMAYVLNNLAGVYSAQGDQNKALQYYRQSLAIREKLDDPKGIALSLNNIGGIYLERGQMDEALSYSGKAYAIAKNLGYPETISEISENLYQIYSAQQQWKDAFRMLEIHKKMQDSLNNDGIKNALLEHELRYKFEKQQALDQARQEKKDALYQEKLKRQSLVNISFGIGFLMLVLIAVVIYRSLRNTRKQKLIIEKQKHLVEEKNNEILDSITYAKRIQSAILPQEKLIKGVFPDSFILYKPKDIVAGDFYWFEVIGNLVFLAAADCTGHGVPGAMVSVVCNNALNRSVKEFDLKLPGEILDKTREIVISEFSKSDEDVKDGMDISLCVLNLHEKKLYWTGAHNPLWIIRKEEIIEMKADKQPVGRFSAAKDFTTHEIELQAGDELYAFTDGFQDQFGGRKGKKFKISQMRELFLSLADLPMEMKKERIEAAFENWRGELEQVDDVCVLGARV